MEDWTEEIEKESERKRKKNSKVLLASLLQFGHKFSERPKPTITTYDRSSFIFFFFYWRSIFTSFVWLHSIWPKYPTDWNETFLRVHAHQFNTFRRLIGRKIKTYKNCLEYFRNHRCGDEWHARQKSSILKCVFSNKIPFVAFTFCLNNSFEYLKLEKRNKTH